MNIEIPPPKKFWHYLILPVTIPLVLTFIVAWNGLFLVFLVGDLVGLRSK